MKTNNVYDKIYSRRYGWLSKFRDRWAGRRLGRQNIPLPDDAMPDGVTFFRDLISGGHGTFATYLQRLERAAKTLARAYKATYVKLDNITRRCSIAEAKVNRLRFERDRSATAYNSSNLQAGRAVQGWLSRGAYLAFLVVLGLIEVPINWLAIQMIVPEQPWIILIVAVLLGGVIIFSGHLIGLFAKRSLIVFQRDRSVQERSFSVFFYLIGLLAITGSALFVIYEVGLIRQAFMDVFNSGGQFSQESFFDYDVPTIVSQESNIVLRRDGWLMVYLNLALLFTGTILSFTNHDSDARYDHAKRAAERSERAVKKQANRLQRLHGQRTNFKAQGREYERDIKLVLTEGFARRKERAAFLAARFGHFCDGYQAARKGRLPKGLSSIDLDAVAQRLATDEHIEILVPEQWQMPLSDKTSYENPGAV